MTNWRKLLIAMDETESSIRAVKYVCELSGCTAGMTVCLLNVYPEPPSWYYREGKSLTEYKEEKVKAAQEAFETAIELLDEHGIFRKNITTISRMASGGTISQTILEEQKKEAYGTIVLGKRGVSKAEEFLFGSISNSVVRECKNFSVWIVG
jgi:nucleotide-binding universal stress UspA family protein